MNPKKWITAIFNAKQAKKSGVVRRSIKSVKKFASVQLLVAEVRKRKFHLIRTKSQFIILCNRGELTVVA